MQLHSLPPWYDSLGYAENYQEELVSEPHGGPEGKLAFEIAAATSKAVPQEKGFPWSVATVSALAGMAVTAIAVAGWRKTGER
ncbi:MAG: hypothetical protein KF886_12445 [Candidatus Hydrogenedentes bacterium]|nr:hypothetical protein [Candidatus Hydrogenedentota bacterium]